MTLEYRIQLIDDLAKEGATIKDYFETVAEIKAIEQANIKQHIKNIHETCQHQLSTLQKSFTLPTLTSSI